MITYGNVENSDYLRCFDRLNLLHILKIVYAVFQLKSK